MLPCDGCAYRESIPGDAHSRCVFDWTTHNVTGLAFLIASAHLTPRTAQWFQFPYNFDPVWGPAACPARADMKDAAKVVPANPLADLLSLLGGRR